MCRYMQNGKIGDGNEEANSIDPVIMASVL